MKIHKECGGLVMHELQWWEEWLVWVVLPVCVVHGGPLTDSDILRV